MQFQLPLGKRFIGVQGGAQPLDKRGVGLHHLRPVLPVHLPATDFKQILGSRVQVSQVQRLVQQDDRRVERLQQLIGAYRVCVFGQ